MTPRGRTMKPQSWIVLKPQTSVVPTFNTRSVCVLVSVQGVDASATFPDRAEALSSEDTVLGGCTGSPEWEWFYLYSLSIFSELLCKQRSGLSLLASHTDVGPPDCGLTDRLTAPWRPASSCTLTQTEGRLLQGQSGAACFNSLISLVKSSDSLFPTSGACFYSLVI